MTNSLENSAELLKMFRWDNDAGVGYFPVDMFNGDKCPYDEEYFKKYQRYAETELGRKITDFRLKICNKYASDLVIDIGVGSGQFVQTRNAAGHKTGGFDICLPAVTWLQENRLLFDPYIQKFSVACFWDSLEHIKNPEEIVKNVERFILISIPIFDDYKHILNSKHFRPDEHYHYFTHKGLIGWFWDLGWRLMEYSDAETEFGREDIRTFALKRVP